MGISARAITDGRNITSASRSVFPSVFFILVFSGLYGFMYFLLPGLSGFSFSLFMKPLRAVLISIPISKKKLQFSM